MSGTAIVRSLLAANAALIAQVPAARIFVGDAPLNTELPAISIHMISGVQRNTVAMSEVKLKTERVQITLNADNPVELWPFVVSALPLSRGVVGVFNVDSVMFESAGPDYQTQDFMVRFT